MTEVVFDTSALLAILRGEVGSDRLVRLLPGAMVSTVNLAEVQTKLVSRGEIEDVAWANIASLGCVSVPFDDGLARIAGDLVKVTCLKGLTLSDRACLALAMQRKARVYTSDRAWASLAPGIQVEFFR